MPRLTFIFDDKKLEMEDTVNEYGVPDNAMSVANNAFSYAGSMPEGAWFGPSDGSPANTWIWRRGNFFD